MNFIFKNLNPYKKELFFGPLLKLSEAIVEILLPLFLSYIINNFYAREKINYLSLSIFLFLLVTIGFTFSILAQYMAATTSQGFGKALRKAFFQKLSKLSFCNTQKFSNSSLINRFTNDIENLEIATAMFIRLVLRVPFICIGSLLMIAFLNKTIALIILASNIVLALVIFIIFKISSPLYEKYNAKLDETSTRLKENLENVQLVRAFNMQDSEENFFEENNNYLKKLATRANFFSYLLNPLSIVILDFTILAVIYFSKFHLDTLFIGDLIAIINYISQMSAAIIVFSNLVTVYTRAYTSFKRLKEFFSLKENTSYGKENIFPISEVAVKFKNVNFSFNSSKKLFENLNFTFKTGEIIGLIGLTAAGKTTFLNLLNKNYSCNSGCVELFGKNIQKYSKKALTENIIFISQKPEFFTNSIKENILLGRKFEKKRFQFALENSDCLEFIEKLENKENTIIYNSAKSLSGGQKQRLALARAFFKTPRILILDDTTSSFDLKTEAQIIKNIYNYSKNENITTFISTQKASTLKLCDKIIVLDKFKIVAFDTPEKLSKTSNLYKNLINKQERSL